MFSDVSLSFVTRFFSVILNKIEDILDVLCCCAAVKAGLFKVFWSCVAAPYGIRLSCSAHCYAYVQSAKICNKYNTPVQVTVLSYNQRSDVKNKSKE